MVDPHDWVVGTLMLAALFAAFGMMVWREVPQALAMSVVACLFLVLQGRNADAILRSGFSHFAEIVVLFTAVGIPAHQIERSGGFRVVAGFLGRHIGRVTHRRSPRLALLLLTAEMLFLTYGLAALMHNVTAILIMVPIIGLLCQSYQFPARWILCGSLVASNLGGFSTKWGDTPNIIESRIWGLSPRDFAVEIMPVNLAVLCVLVVSVAFLTRRLLMAREVVSKSEAESIADGDLVAQQRAAWESYLREAAAAVDGRLLLVGTTALIGFVASQAFWPHLQIGAGALTILVAVLLDWESERLSSLTSLGGDVYLVFGSIFVLAGCVENSWIGASLQQVIADTHAAPWAIGVAAYLGTMFTEAASWAASAGTRIFPLDGSHTAAWALGAGICAGSSSIVTAASAGIILCAESARFRDPADRITFRRYLAFGFPFSLFMLAFYCLYFSFIRY